MTEEQIRILRKIAIHSLNREFHQINNNKVCIRRKISNIRSKYRRDKRTYITLEEASEIIHTEFAQNTINNTQ